MPDCYLGGYRMFLYSPWIPVGAGSPSCAPKRGNLGQWPRAVLWGNPWLELPGTPGGKQLPVSQHGNRPWRPQTKAPHLAACLFFPLVPPLAFLHLQFLLPSLPFPALMRTTAVLSWMRTWKWPSTFHHFPKEESGIQRRVGGPSAGLEAWLLELQPAHTHVLTFMTCHLSLGKRKWLCLAESCEEWALNVFRRNNFDKTASVGGREPHRHGQTLKDKRKLLSMRLGEKGGKVQG